MSVKDLEQENKILTNRLKIAQEWMQKEVKNQITKIAKQNIADQNKDEAKKMIWENMQEAIAEKIVDFFWEILLLNIPASVIDNIVAAELSFYNFEENRSKDGLWVITSYHKALDTLIESYITKGFRKFAIKKGQKILRTNDVLEKSLHQVVNNGYILSVGRLFHLLQRIKKSQDLFEYGKCFSLYLDKYYYLKDILEQEDFYIQFSRLVNSEIVGKKRHSWTISLQETKQARSLLIGDLKDKNCLIYKLATSQELI